MRLQLNCLLDLRNSLVHTVFLEESEGPVSVARVVHELACLLKLSLNKIGAVRCIQTRRNVVNIGHSQLGLLTNINGVLPFLVHVEDESEVVVSVLMLAVVRSAQVEVAHRHVIVLVFEVCQTQIVVHLRVGGLQLITSLERLDTVLEQAHLEERNA